MINETLEADREYQKAIAEAKRQAIKSSDCIDRQAALDIFDDYNVAVENGQIEAYSRDRKRLCDLPPVQPQRTGKWIPADSQCGIRCSACGAPVDDFCHSIDYIDLVYEPNFCPNCGAKMEGVNNEKINIQRT